LAVGINIRDKIYPNLPPLAEKTEFLGIGWRFYSLAVGFSPAKCIKAVS
jgi:hypothetical protein